METDREGVACTKDNTEGRPAERPAAGRLPEPGRGETPAGPGRAGPPPGGPRLAELTGSGQLGGRQVLYSHSSHQTPMRGVRPGAAAFLPGVKQT